MEIGDWLRNLGLGQYEATFRENQIDADVLPDLTDQHLKDIGVSLGHRLRMLRAIRERAGDAPVKAQPAALAARSESKPQDAAERRQLTVMFVDLVGSTEMSRKLDPEEMRDIIRLYQNTVAGEVGRYDGHLAKFMGDGVLAYFGWPRSHEDEAERAIRAGLAIAGAVARLSTSAGAPLAARVGVATGLVVVGDLIGEGGAQEEAVVGETPNLAARLQTLAEPGGVIISPVTRVLIGGLFDLVELGPREFKGFAEPVRAWQALGEGSAAGRFEALHGGVLTPLVGREHELGLLFERYQRAKDGEGQIALVSGEPGIGKSRIVGALKETLASERCLALSHFCSPFYTNSSLHPIIGLLERAAGFERDESPELRFAKLQSLLAAAEETFRDTIPLIAALMSVPVSSRYPTLDLTAEAKKQQTYKALLNYFGGLAAKQPILAVFEDVHWIDPSTLEFLNQLAERIEKLPILAVMTFRPEFNPPWLSQNNVAWVPLGRLARRQGASMIQAITGSKSLPVDVLNQIVAKTDGVPLFVEELTKTLLESGLLRESDDRYVLVDALPTLAIPATLHDSLLARLDRLGQAKDTAQLGAAIGREFSYELLAAVSTLDDQGLRTALSQLTSAGLVFRRGNPPDASYTFKHALVRDAAYSSLLKSRRQQIHARVAQALNDRFPEQVSAAPELLAHHFAEAGATKPAIHYWELAGKRALERSANVEAVAHFRAGLAVLMDLDEESRVRNELPLQIGLGSALTSVKGYTDSESRAAYQRARDICLDLGEKDRLFPVLYGLWNFDVVAGKYHEAKEVSRQFVTLAEQHGASGPLVAAYSAMGTTSTFMGSWSDGSRYAQASTKLYDPELHASLKFEGADDPGVQAGLVDALSLWNLGYPDGALKAIGQAVKLAEELRHANSQGYAMGMVPLLHHFIGNAREAATTAEYCKEFSRNAYLPLWMVYSMVWRGWAQACLGDHVEGIAELQEGMKGWNAAGGQAHTSGMLAALGDAYRAAGRYEDAVHAVDRGIQFVAESGEGLREAELNRLKGVLLLRMESSEPSQGESWLLRALEIARQQESRSMELRIAIDLARLWQSQGTVGEARNLLAPIYGWFTEGFEMPSLKDAKALLDTLN